MAAPLCLKGLSSRKGVEMFLFFSNRFGCLKSVLLSVGLTLLLLLVLGVVRAPQGW